MQRNSIPNVERRVLEYAKAESRMVVAKIVTGYMYCAES